MRHEAGSPALPPRPHATPSPPSTPTFPSTSPAARSPPSSSFHCSTPLLHSLSPLTLSALLFRASPLPIVAG
eukprot:767804-Hanusia_phi.AAC.6